MKDARLLVILALAALAGCRSATEIELSIRTDLPCTDKAEWKGVAVYVGKPNAAFENKAPALKTTRCDKTGTVGTLVVYPSGDNDEQVGIRVVAGVTIDAESCKQEDYDGCIVARRAVRYQPHQTVPVDVELTADCVHIPCDAQSTCVSGVCKPISSVKAQPEPVSMIEPPLDKRVRCGDQGLYCPTVGEVCCLSVHEDGGVIMDAECKRSDECGGTVLNCDDSGDCAPDKDEKDGSPALCMLATEASGSTWGYPNKVFSSACIHASDYRAKGESGLILCEDGKSCMRPGNVTIQCIGSRGPNNGNALPGYHWCEYDTNKFP